MSHIIDTSTITAITTTKAPAAVGPFSQAVVAGDLVFVSGQLPIDPLTGAFAAGDTAAQARQCIRNIASILASEEIDLSAVVKTTVLLVDLRDFAEVNAVYASFFTGPVLPARATFQVAALPLGALVEIDATAYSASPR